MIREIRPLLLITATWTLFALTVAGTGCKTTSGASFGAAIGIGQPPRTAAAPPSPSPLPRNAGQEQAGRNSLRNAYKFLEKGMPEKAQRELRKAEERLGRDYWYNYYMAGALQMQDKPSQANDFFELALRYSPTDGLRSRVRVCQSFLYFTLDQETKSGQMLDLAVELDSSNSAAISLRDDFKAGEAARIAEPEDRRDGKGKGKEKGKGKGKGKARKVGSRDEFLKYFLMEMPD